MEIEVFGERVIVRRIADEQTKGGIILPNQAKQASLTGEVVAVGPHCDWVVPGDTVLFARYSGTDQPFYDIVPKDDKYKDCMFMNEEDILGKIKEGTDE